MNKTPHQSATLTAVSPVGSVGAFACCRNQRLPLATRTPSGEAKFVGNDALIVPFQLSFAIFGMRQPYAKLFQKHMYQ